MAITAKTDTSKSGSERCPAAVFLTDRPVYHTPGVTCFCCRRHAQMNPQRTETEREILDAFADSITAELDADILSRLPPSERP